MYFCEENHFDTISTKDRSYLSLSSFAKEWCKVRNKDEEAVFLIASRQRKYLLSIERGLPLPPCLSGGEMIE